LRNRLQSPYVLKYYFITYRVELSIGYGVVILSISAVLVLLLATVPLPAAHANTFLIDNFTDDNLAMLCDDALIDKTVQDKTHFAFQLGLTEVIDGIRECQLTLLQDNPPETAATTIVQATGQYTGIMGAGVQAMSYLQYDGIADGVVGGGRTLGLDLTNSNNLRILYSFADIQVAVTATLIDSGGDSASLNGILVAGTNSATELNFPLNNFVIQNAALSLNNIDEFNFNFTATSGTDFVVEFIDITMQNGPIEFNPDHYFGYQVTQKTIPKFSPLQITLGDQFETGIYDVLKPIKMYNPAKKNGAAVHDEVTHLKAYKIRGDHNPVQDIVLTNQFEQLVVNTNKAIRLLVPTAKSHDGPTDPLIDTPVDHFKCYKLQVIDRFPLDVSKKRVRVFDTNFKEKSIVRIVGDPLLCNPVAKFDPITGQQLSEIKNPDLHLTCYKVKPRPNDEEHDRIKFDTNNQFGPEFLKTKLHDERTASGKIFRHELCVPTMKQIITNG